MFMERSKFDPAGPVEGSGHGDVAEVGRRSDAWRGVRSKDPDALGEDLVDVSHERLSLSKPAAPAFTIGTPATPGPP
jgi:hypothetical protein